MPVDRPIDPEHERNDNKQRIFNKFAWAVMIGGSIVFIILIVFVTIVCCCRKKKLAQIQAVEE